VKSIAQTLVASIFALIVSQSVRAEAEQAAASKTIICEAEDFRVLRGGWKRQRYGENYYVGTFADTFLSRKAFLGAPEQCKPSTASLRVEIPARGRYLALVRYEAAYRFETQFRLVIEQSGSKKFDRLYGARDNIKIWPFGSVMPGIKTPVG